MKNFKTIGLVLPSGNIKNPDEINQKIALLEQKFKVKKFYNENTSLRYLSDLDENRIAFLENAFLDDEVDIVLSVRGGFGALRIIDKINYEKIKNSSKVYIGSSDATILLMALNDKTKIKCFHGLMVSNGFIENLEKNLDIIENSKFEINYKPIKKFNNNVSGCLWGGNLSSIVSTFSSFNFNLDENIILFLEDLNEPLYKIDKMLFEIYRNEKLKNKIKGIIFGDFYFEEEEIMPLLNEYANLFKVNCYLSKDITHKINNVTLPFYKKVELF